MLEKEKDGTFPDLQGLVQIQGIRGCGRALRCKTSSTGSKENYFVRRYLLSAINVVNQENIRYTLKIFQCVKR